MRLQRLTIVAAWLASVLGPSDAQAYVRSRTFGGLPIAWGNSDSCIHITVASETRSHDKDEFLLKAVTQAADQWSQQKVPCAGLSFMVATNVNEAPRAIADGFNSVFYRNAQNCTDGDRASPETAGFCLGPGVLMLTVTHAKASDGRILEADIEINAYEQEWVDLDIKASSTAYDLQNALTHEMGHFIGLAHSCRNDDGEQAVDDLGVPVPFCNEASEEILQTTMAASVDLKGELSKRTLSEDDQRGLCAIYPSAQGQACESNRRVVDGGCAMTRQTRSSCWPGILGMSVLLFLSRVKKKFSSRL